MFSFKVINDDDNKKKWFLSLLRSTLCFLISLFKYVMHEIYTYLIMNFSNIEFE